MSIDERAWDEKASERTGNDQAVDERAWDEKTSERTVDDLTADEKAWDEKASERTGDDQAVDERAWDVKSSERARDLSLAEAATSIIFVATKVLCVCRNKTRFSSRQKYASRNKRFVAPNTCLSQQKFCRDKNDTHGSSRQ